MPELVLEPRLGSLSRARRWARAHAERAGMRHPDLQVVELLTSEAVANALHHGPPEPVRVSVHSDGELFTVRVADAGNGVPVLRTTGPETPGGHGVRIIDRLAAAWGVDPHREGGKTVWFALPIDPSGAV